MDPNLTKQGMIPENMAVSLDFALKKLHKKDVKKKNRLTDMMSYQVIQNDSVIKPQKRGRYKEY